MIVWNRIHRTIAIRSILLMPLLGLAACSSDDDSANTSTMPAPDANPGDEITLDGLDGNWISSCVESASDATYSTTTITVADNAATVSQSIYTDNSCSTPSAPANIVTERSLVFDGNTSATSLGDASHVEWTVESRLVDGENDNTGVNVSVWDLMLITNDTLYFGDRTGDNNGTTEALRPSALDEIVTYTMNE